MVFTLGHELAVYNELVLANRVGDKVERVGRLGNLDLTPLPVGGDLLKSQEGA